MARVTVEDCLQRIPNRFSMALLASRRSRMILQGAHSMVDSSNKPCVTALREIAAGKIGWDYSVDEILRGDVPEEIMRKRHNNSMNTSSRKGRR